jgi:hypothetical protein
MISSSVDDAGVDIKEIQASKGHEALIGANRGCFAAFAAVFELNLSGTADRIRDSFGRKD